MLLPVVAAPTFAIRKPAVAVFTLGDYVAAGIMAAAEAKCLQLAVATRANILVAGGVGASCSKKRRGRGTLHFAN
jgi:Flp pilus assembly CpaF family ATPase